MGESGRRGLQCLCQAHYVDLNSVLPDLIVSAAGSLLAVVVALVSFVLTQRHKNKLVVRNLADELAARRAFWQMDPKDQALGIDGERCVASVRDTQLMLAGFRNEVALDTDLRNELNRMVLACVTFKDAVDYEPLRWQHALMSLREGLVLALPRLERLVHLKPGTLPSPGSTRGHHLK